MIAKGPSPGSHVRRALRYLNLLTFCAVLANPAGADELPFEKFEPIEFGSVEKATEYRIQADGTVAADSRCGASGLTLSLEAQGTDVARTPWLVWRWRVDEPMSGTAEKTRGGDDFAARVYVLFDFEQERATFWQRLQHDLAKALYGEVMPGLALVYVWAGQAPVGSHWPNPYAEQAQVVVLRSHANEADRDPGWRGEHVNVFDDFARLFGRSPPKVAGVAIMTDSDDTCTRARASYGPLEFMRVTSR